MNSLALQEGSCISLVAIVRVLLLRLWQPYWLLAYGRKIIDSAPPILANALTQPLQIVELPAHTRHFECLWVCDDAMANLGRVCANRISDTSPSFSAITYSHLLAAPLKRHYSNNPELITAWISPQRARLLHWINRFDRKLKHTPLVKRHCSRLQSRSRG